MTDSQCLPAHFGTTLVTCTPVIKLVTREKEGQHDCSLMQLAKLTGSSAARLSKACSFVACGSISRYARCHRLTRLSRSSYTTAYAHTNHRLQARFVSYPSQEVFERVLDLDFTEVMLVANYIRRIGTVICSKISLCTC
jgi:hypothetical protein